MPLVLSKFMKLLSVRTHRYGTLRLRSLTVKDEQFLQDLVAAHLPPREFTARIIHHQLASPQLAEGEVYAWSPRLLARVATTWWRARLNGASTLPEAMPPLEGFQQAVEVLVEAHARRQRESFDQTMGSRIDFAHVADLSRVGQTRLLAHELLQQTRAVDSILEMHQQQHSFQLAAAADYGLQMDHAQTTAEVLDSLQNRITGLAQRPLSGILDFLQPPIFVTAARQHEAAAAATAFAAADRLALLDQSTALAACIQDVASLGGPNQAVLKSIQADLLLEQNLTATAHMHDRYASFLEQDLTAMVNTQVHYATLLGQDLPAAARLQDLNASVVAQQLDVFPRVLAANSLFEQNLAALTQAQDHMTGIFGRDLAAVSQAQDHMAGVFGRDLAATAQAHDIVSLVQQKLGIWDDANRIGGFSTEPHLAEISREVFGTIQTGVGSVVDSLLMADPWAKLVRAPVWEESLRALTQARFDVDRLLPLVDMAAILRRMDRLERARDVLATAGFAIVYELLPESFLLRLASFPLQMAAPLITKSLLALTRTPGFARDLEALFCRSRKLRGRWKAVASGLGNHCRGDFHASIRTLLPEAEGILADALEQEGRVTISGTKVYALDTNGQIQTWLDKKGKEHDQEVRGLQQLVDRAHFHDRGVLDLVASLIKTSVGPDRQPILHGRTTDYATPIRSTQILFLVVVLAEHLDDLLATKKAKRQVGR